MKPITVGLAPCDLAFAAAGITVDVPNAYCVVRADGARKLFAYASVIDNQSQDLIFVRGVNGEAAPAGASVMVIGN